MLLSSVLFLLPKEAPLCVSGTGLKAFLVVVTEGCNGNELITLFEECRMSLHVTIRSVFTYT